MTEQLRVLVVDDQPAVVKALQVLFELNDIPSVAATSPAQACRVASSETLGAVVQDMNFSPNETSGREGVNLFHALRSIDPSLPILLITAWASLESAVELVRAGASDYLEKPWNDDRLIASVRNLLRLRELEVENARLREEIAGERNSLARDFDLCGIVYASEAMHRVVSLAVNVAGSEAPVLVSGPSGCGKEKIAEVVQANSRRRDGPFVRVNVGAIPEELMESELFGAEAGAYTGISGRRIGHFESAHGGTLLLDEVDALSLAGQVKLLRVLQSGEFRRLGSSRSLHADVRVISATNADLRAAVDDGRFREDLYYRINVVELAVPALRARVGDILPLARHFLDRFGAEEGVSPRQLSAEAERGLLEHPWPGNVRELENRIQRATVMAGGDEVTCDDLGLGRDAERSAVEGSRGRLGADDTLERQRVVEVLAASGGVVARAAERLGISRQALYRRMARLGIELERRPTRG